MITLVCIIGFGLNLWWQRILLRNILSEICEDVKYLYFWHLPFHWWVLSFSTHPIWLPSSDQVQLNSISLPLCPLPPGICLASPVNLFLPKHIVSRTPTSNHDPVALSLLRTVGVLGKCLLISTGNQAPHWPLTLGEDHTTLNYYLSQMGNKVELLMLRGFQMEPGGR